MIWRIPATALSGILRETVNIPDASVRIFVSSVWSKSTASDISLGNPTPTIVTVEPGGPLTGDKVMFG